MKGKGFFAVLMAVVVAAAMTGCGNKGTGKSGQEAGDTREMTYAATPLPVDGVEGDISSMAVRDGTLYMQTWERNADEQKRSEVQVDGGSAVNHLYSANLDGSNVKEIPLNLSEGEYLTDFFIEENDFVTYMTNTFDEKRGKSCNMLVRKSMDGGEEFRENLTASLGIGDEQNISNVLVDTDGNVILIGRREVYILDEKLNLSGQVTSKSDLEDAVLTKDGEVICVSISYIESDGNGQELRLLDVEKRQWGQTYGVDVTAASGSLVMGGGEYDFYFKGSSGIYGYELENSREIKLLDYAASNLTLNSVYELVPAGDGRFVGLVQEDKGGRGLVLYAKADPSTLTEKTTIVFAGIWMDEDLKEEVVAFNKENRDYQIQVKDYSEYVDGDPVSKLNLDLAAGNIPDLIDLSNLPLDSYAEKGLLENLLPYFERDAELSTDDIMDGALEAMRTEGSLYFAASGFQISTLIGRTRDVGEEPGWTFEELKTLLDRQEEGVRPFYAENKSEIMCGLLGSNSLTDFVDWQTGECSFDSQDFRELLEICNRGREEETDYNGENPTMKELIRNGKVLFVETDATPEEGQLYEQLYGERITYIGYPGRDRQGSYYHFYPMIGMSSRSNVKDGAWEFLRTFMTREYQGRKLVGMHGEIPVRKDCFDMQIQAWITDVPYTNEFGREIKPLDRKVYISDDFEVTLNPVTKQQAEQFIHLVNHTKKRGRYNEDMMSIIQEEVKPYFAGDKSLNDTVNLIQNRITTYVNESR